MLDKLEAYWDGFCARFRAFAHNCVAHPLLGILFVLCGRYPEWAESFHDWTVRN